MHPIGQGEVRALSPEQRSDPLLGTPLTVRDFRADDLSVVPRALYRAHAHVPSGPSRADRAINAAANKTPTAPRVRALGGPLAAASSTLCSRTARARASHSSNSLTAS